jgi:hypothetical protein
MSLRAYDPAAPACPRCGTRHTARQRCPLDPLPMTGGALLDDAVSRRGGPSSRYRAVSTGFGYVLAAVATAVLVASLVAAAVYIDQLTRSGADVRAASFGAAISIGIGFAFGVELLYVSKRVYAKVVYCILAVVLLTAGVFMLTFAPAVRQVNTAELAEYRAFRALLLFGAGSLLAGVALAVLCVRWALRPEALRRLRRWARIGGSIYGVVLGIEGLFLLLALFTLIRGESTFSSNGDEFSVVQQAIGFTVIAVWFFVPGVLLTYHGISASMGEGSAQYRPPVAVLGVAVFAAVVLAGALNMTSGDAIAAPMPLLHVLAAGVPGVTYVALASRGSLFRGVPVRGLTWRQLTLAFALSMGVAAMIAMYVNSIAGACATVLLLAHNGTFHLVYEGSDFSYRLGHAKEILSHNEQWAANLIAIAVVPPLVEEFSKGLSARFMMRGNTTRSQAFALGAAAGAGFGFLEGLFYGAGGITDNLGDWWIVMLVRGGSTSLHVFNTGLVGVAWWYWSVAKRPRTAAMLFGAAVAAHAVWNGLSVTLFSQILWLRTVDNRTLEIATYAMVAVLGTLFITAITLIARRLREPVPPPAAGTPLGAMAPWLG